MIPILFLILLPLLLAPALLLIRANQARKIVASVAILAVFAASIFLAAHGTAGSFFIPIEHHLLSHIVLALEAAMALYVIYVGIKSKNFLISLAMLLQTGLISWFELTHSIEAKSDLFVDKFTIIMALINGLVGGGICLYAISYMSDYHQHHPDVPDRRPLFFSLLFLFMGAMFGLIFADNLLWLYFFWEVTTFCSFLLIGYTQTPEAKTNARRALFMNLLGGIAFAIAIVWLHHQTGAIELQTLITSKKSLVLLPAALLCFAGITKAAQLPFSNWLLGAMVAPTPVSALLHSSTMVKAGVYMVLRMAPVITDTKAGLAVAGVGAATFLVASLAAITCSDAKRVLAWSTIANLGLIVLCGGVGTYAAVWAGVLLIIFHAVAKCLLFLCVGVVEHKLHTRDIDAMTALIVKLPKVCIMMLIGMAGMFLAPFGMLISKWAVLKAVIDAAPALSVLIVFGSSATLFFWVKWMGKLVQVVGTPQPLGKELHLGEALAMWGLSALTFLACVLFPLISIALIEPYVTGVYGHSTSLGAGNITIMVMMMGLVMLFPLGFIMRSNTTKVVDPYLCGANIENTVTFTGSGGAVESVAMNNYHMRNLISEKWLMRWGTVFCAATLAAMVVLACL
ncbi:MAG TPA: proton-conducting transporter membrane subunit [Phycisphaerae bacterium]|nr:proton-conducting transporter membrane subunit [Phycisphaerae bacterium]